MKIQQDRYFELAFPGILLLILGMYSLPTKVFTIQYDKVRNSSIVNKDFLIKVTLFGILLRFLSFLGSNELTFFIYLLSMIRFVGAFALISINIRFIFFTIIIFLIEAYSSFLEGMFHDLVMWLIFFLLHIIYVVKPKFQLKVIGMLIMAVFILFIQAIKYSYRERVWGGGEEANLETVIDVGSTKTSQNSIIGIDNLLSTLNRGNQAWIFASTVDNMDRVKNFQGMNNVNKYIEAALLPRAFAPDKLKSGDKEIFNQFSGHMIGEGTSMGLGVFSDGYIAYGAWGVYLFCFILGLIFSLTFKLVERWTKVSPFYVLLLLPLLNYAVRPDCELQTTINHLFKGVIVFGAVVYLTRKRFTLDSQENKRKLLHLNLVTTKK
jgi:hypothetical protein